MRLHVCIFQKKDKELENMSTGVGTCHAALGMFIGKFFFVDWRVHMPDTLEGTFYFFRKLTDDMFIFHF